MILRGARQVGKSWLVREWGRRRYATVIEANFERMPELRACFDARDPTVVLRRMETILRRPIPSDGTALVFLDEIQGAPAVLPGLRWFAEEAPQVPVIAAGSLLDFAATVPGQSMPVGRVTYRYLEPMGFEEFCRAVGEERLVAWLEGDVTAKTLVARTAIPSEIHARAAGVFREWLLVGGMPAAVEEWRTTKSHLAVTARHGDLLTSLRDDFPKYATRAHHERLAAVLGSVPRQLGTKFTYRAVDPEERAEPLRRAVDLLCRARVCHRVAATPAQGVPLGAGASQRAFRLIHMDVGLAVTDLGLGLREFEAVSDVVLVNRGAIAEQGVGQLLRLTFPPNVDPALFWWHREKKGSEAELDYVYAHGSRIVPIEVKAGEAGAMRSLHGFVAERHLPLGVRVNLAPPAVQDVDVPVPSGSRAKYRLLSIPAYLVEQLPRLLDELR